MMRSVRNFALISVLICNLFIYVPTLLAQSLAYQIICGGTNLKDAVVVLNTPRDGSLELAGQLNYDHIARRLQCVYHFDFKIPPKVGSLTKNWSCVEDSYLKDPQSTYFDGFYFVELYTAGLAVDSKAEISRVEFGTATPVTTESCYIQPW